jgi:hypothetical protein
VEVDNLPAIRLRAGSTFWVVRERALEHAGVRRRLLSTSPDAEPIFSLSIS